MPRVEDGVSQTNAANFEVVQLIVQEKCVGFFTAWNDKSKNRRFERASLSILQRYTFFIVSGSANVYFCES